MIYYHANKICKMSNKLTLLNAQGLRAITKTKLEIFILKQ